MFTRAKLFLLGLLLGSVASATIAGQGTLSNQVLQLLSRTNSWTGQNTFSNFRLVATAIPSDTTNRLYADASHALYWNGSALGGGGGGGSNHNILSSTHSDSAAASVTRGALIIGNSTPAWSRLTVGAAGRVLLSDGTDVAWGTDGSSLTSLTAANLTGTLPAISGVNLTNLNASNLASGTVPLARLSGITNTQIDGSAAISYSKLSLSGSILNADVNASAAIAYSKLTLTGSIVNADISASAAIALTKLAQGGATSGQVLAWSGSAWAAAAAAAGTVTSVALSLPAELTVSGSPVTSSGTLSATWASEVQHKVFAAPSGADGTPTFRLLVNSDLPASGVSAGSYPKVTVNAQGVITGSATTIALATETTGTLARANGGTGVTVSADDTLLIGSGTAWVAQTLTSGPLVYSTSTNGFTNTLLWGGAATGSNFVGGVPDVTSTTSGTVQNTEYTLNSITIPASAFNASTRAIHVQAWGTTAANADAKNIKIYFGATAVATVTGSTASGKDFFIDLTVVRTGSSTQSGVATIQVDTGVAPAMAATAALAETESSTIVVAVKSANTASAAASGTGKGMLLTFIN